MFCLRGILPKKALQIRVRPVFILMVRMLKKLCLMPEMAAKLYFLIKL